MSPRNENNFLVEITPEVMSELNRIYMHSDDEPIVELHYSPYWKSTQANRKEKENERSK